MSFRARLTPKFWRCQMKSGPPAYPREEARSRDVFDAWLREYEERSRPFATCRFVQAVGSRSVHAENVRLLQLHDRETRVGERLALA